MPLNEGGRRERLCVKLFISLLWGSGSGTSLTPLNPTAALGDHPVMGEKGAQARRPGFGFTCTTRVFWFDVIMYESGFRINRQTDTQNRVQK